MAQSRDQNQRLSELVNALKALDLKDITFEQTGLYLDNIHEAWRLICESKTAKLDTQFKSYHLGEILAVLRNLVGHAVNDKQKANFVLTSLLQQNSLTHLTHLFVSYSENLHDDLIKNESSVEEITILILLRILQVFHNLLNLYFSSNNFQHIDFDSNFVLIFDLKHLRTINGLYELILPDDRINLLLKKLCYVFTSNIYCYLKNNESMQDKVLMNPAQEMAQVWQHILNHVKLEISEWSLWIIFLGLKKDEFFKIIYTQVGCEYRLLLLDIVLEYIESEHKTTLSNLTPPEFTNRPLTNQTSDKALPNDCLTFMTEHFIKEVGNFMQLANSGNEQILADDNIRLVSKLGSLLLKVSSIEGYKEVIQNEESLMDLLVSLLKNIQILGKSNPDSVFATRGQLKDVTEGEMELSNPAYGFKRDIIGLIANITYRNTRAQDYLRTSDGLAALLDCAKIDARNPFILQWSIFAIRNALESNLANQQFIAQMNQQGIVKDDLLDRIQPKVN